MLRRLRNKDGAVVLSLVIILMLIFPMIISGLIDMTNCTIIKRNLKQNLNMASKSAANTVDLPATRNGVYRIKDGVLNKEIYNFSLYNSTGSSNIVDSDNTYYNNENDAAKVFYTLLSYNGLVNYDITNPENIEKDIVTSNNKSPLDGNKSEKYSRVSYSQGEEKNASGKVIQRAAAFSMLVVNNDYDYVNAVVRGDISTRDKVSLTDTNVGQPGSSIIATGDSGKVDVSFPNLTIDTINPTVVSVGIERYELSPIFKIFGFQNIYLKEYATSELVVTDLYWE